MQTFWRQRIFAYLFALTLIVIPIQGNPIPPIELPAQLGFYIARYILPAILGVLVLEGLYRLSTQTRKL